VSEHNIPYDLVLPTRKTFLWDSLSGSWEAIADNHGQYRDENGSQRSGFQILSYAPYTDVDGDGILCGFDMLDSGVRYWFKLPRKPTRPLTFHAHQLVQVIRGDTVTGIFEARLDTARTSITVPAGTYNCYRLTLTFDGNIGVGQKVIHHLTNVLYLCPSVGIVKRTVADLRMRQLNDTDPPSPDENTTSVFELMSYQFP
jgi:hypothetical protein